MSVLNRPKVKCRNSDHLFIRFSSQHEHCSPVFYHLSFRKFAVWDYNQDLLFIVDKMSSQTGFLTPLILYQMSFPTNEEGMGKLGLFLKLSFIIVAVIFCFPPSGRKEENFPKMKYQTSYLLWSQHSSLCHELQGTFRFAVQCQNGPHCALAGVPGVSGRGFDRHSPSVYGGPQFWMFIFMYFSWIVLSSAKMHRLKGTAHPYPQIEQDRLWHRVSFFGAVD